MLILPLLQWLACAESPPFEAPSVALVFPVGPWLVQGYVWRDKAAIVGGNKELAGDFGKNHFSMKTRHWLQMLNDDSFQKTRIAISYKSGQERGKRKQVEQSPSLVLSDAMAIVVCSYWSLEL